jgi:dTDP-4-amino-4,6-dideoxygalactose transaminase
MCGDFPFWRRGNPRLDRLVYGDIADPSDEGHPDQGACRLRIDVRRGRQNVGRESLRVLAEADGPPRQRLSLCGIPRASFVWPMARRTLIPVARPAVSAAEVARVQEVFASRWLGLGLVTEEFERAVAAELGQRHVVATNSGTSALHLALAVAGIGPGDEVIVPSLTFAATAQAVLMAGATPVLCDVDPVTLNVRAEHFDAVRTPATRAVMPVHYRGLPAELGPMLDWARRHRIRVIEDAAHAFGSSYDDGTPIGGLGDITCFSFDPIKVITTGEGGAAVFSDDGDAETAKVMRNLGVETSGWSRLSSTTAAGNYDVVLEGFRYHMPNFCAAIGLAQLERFEGFRARKREVLASYQAEFRDHPAIDMPEMPVANVCPFLALLLVEDRNRFMTHMRERGVATGIHYPPLHRLTRFKDYSRTDLAIATAAGSRLCTVPLLNDQEEDERKRVIDAVFAYG